MAHQLNNPLSGITLFTKLMMEEYTLEKGAREDLDRILKDAERCRDTVKELLEFTRQTRQLMRPNDINRSHPPHACFFSKIKPSFRISKSKGNYPRICPWFIPMCSSSIICL